MKRFIAMMMAVVTMMSVCVSANAATAGSYDKKSMSMHDLMVYAVGKNGNNCEIERTYRTNTYVHESENTYRIMSFTNLTRYTEWTVYCEGWNEVVMFECDSNDNIKVYIADLDKNNKIVGDYWVGTAKMCYGDNYPHFRTQTSYSDNKYSNGYYEEYSAIFTKCMYILLTK